MGLIGQECRERGILFVFREISSSPPMGQFTAAQDTVNGTNGGRRLHVHVLHLPQDSLVSTEKIIIVQTSSQHFDDQFDFRRYAVRAYEGAA